MGIHPKARSIFTNLKIPGPVRRYFDCPEIHIDLGSSTNPYLGHQADYPDLNSFRLKELYRDLIYTINPPLNFGLHSQKFIKPDHMLFTVGSSEGIDLLLRTFAEPNKDTIVVTDPSFPAYEHWGKLHNLKVAKVPLKGDHLQHIDVDAILNVNPKLIFLCEPNNPTGTMLDRHVIHELCSKCDGLVIVDEAYIEFSDLPSLIYDWHQYKDNLVILRTLSKAWGMASARCGVLIADELIIKTLRYIQIPFGFSTSSQIEVLERLLSPQPMMATWGQIKTERNYLKDQLVSLKNVNKVYRSQSNFLFLILDNFSDTMKHLNENHVFVLNCSDVIPNSMRVSMSSKENNLRFLDILKVSQRNL